MFEDKEDQVRRILNAENQITQMDGGSATYAYDGEGRRMKKTFNGETTYTFYGPGGVLCEFSTVAGTSTATSASANDRITYRTSDKLGSAVLMITNTGSIVENNRTLPYGESFYERGCQEKFLPADRPPGQNNSVVAASPASVVTIC